MYVDSEGSCPGFKGTYFLVRKIYSHFNINPDLPKAKFAWKNHEQNITISVADLALFCITSLLPNLSGSIVGARL